MERVLIVNADDFGLSKGQNYGIIEACRNGVVTSTTALVNGAAIDHAAQLSRSTPELAVGMHFVLTLGEPLSAMPGLTRDGRLGKWIWQQAEEDILPLEEIAHELACQYRRFVELFGHEPTHIDSHHHVHMFAQIYPIVAAFAREKGIALRIDRQVAAQSGLDQQAARSSAGFSSEFYGEAVSEELFLQTLDASIARGERSLEVMCHPAYVDRIIMGSAYCYPRLDELDVLTSASLKAAVADRGYRLGTYRDVSPTGERESESSPAQRAGLFYYAGIAAIFGLLDHTRWAVIRASSLSAAGVSSASVTMTPSSPWVGTCRTDVSCRASPASRIGFRCL